MTSVLQSIVTKIYHHCFGREDVYYEKIKMLSYGQMISFLLSASGATNDVLVHSCNFYAPTFQMALVYLVLALVFYLFPKCCRLRDTLLFTSTTASNTVMDRVMDRGEENEEKEEEDGDFDDHNSPPSTSTISIFRTVAPQYYLRIFIVALCDVEANYLAYLSYQYTSFTSVTLLMSLSIPSTMISSAIILCRHYTKYHYFGASICFIGSCLTVLSDTSKGNTSNNNKSSLFGDILAICGAILYGLVDTLMEWAIKLTTMNNKSSTAAATPEPDDVYRSPLDSFMYQFGFSGFLISLLQVSLLERSQVSNYFHNSGGSSSTASLHANSIVSCSTSTLWGITSLFVLVTSFSYIGSTRFLLHYEAAVFNLSLLTSNGWAVLFALLYDEERKKNQPGIFFFLSLIVIIMGVIVYEIAPSPLIYDDGSAGMEKMRIDNEERSSKSSISGDSSDDDDSASAVVFPALLLQEYFNKTNGELRSNEQKCFDSNNHDLMSRRNGYDLI